MATAQTLHYSMSVRAISALKGLLEHIHAGDRSMKKDEQRLRVVVCDGDITYSVRLRPDASETAVSRLRELCSTVRDMVVRHVSSDTE